jgi:4-amino-4-deoxychorismate lyase
MTIINFSVSDCVSSRDRGLAYGDGLFETIAYVNQTLHNWSLHWARLQRGARQLSLPHPDELTVLEQIELELEYANHDQNNACVIKIILTRGQGGRGYRVPDLTEASLIVSLHQWPAVNANNYQQGIQLTLCETCLSQQPALAGIKHLNRLEQVLACKELGNSVFQDGLMLACSDNELLDRHIIEATSSNVFFVFEDRLLTPKINRCGIQGTIREQIKKLAGELDITLEELSYSLKNIYKTSEIFLCNSVFGVLPVAAVQYQNIIDWHYQSPCTITRRLSEIINPELNRPVVTL